MTAGSMMRSRRRWRGAVWLVDYRGPADHVRDPDAMFMRNAKQILGASWLMRDRAGIARWLLLSQILPQVERHREFLRTHNVVAVHQHGEFMPGQMALNLACRQEGAAFFWGFWSALVFLSGWYQHAFADLVFAWGSYDVGHDHALSFDYRYAVQCGILGYDGREPNDRENAAALRAHLAARPRFVVTLFDSSHHPSAIHHSTENCAAFYRIVLKLICENPDWGCLIKSKGPAYDSLPVEPGLQDVVSRLEAEGRCQRLAHATKPSLAALASDAVVCFSVNSAGIQAAVGSGRPTLHFDPNNLTMHPLSVAGGDGKIIFRDAETFCAALRALAAGDRRFGDLAPWANLFDPFQDGMGRRRSGEVMRDYMAARDRGLSRDAALRAAVEAHAARYGPALATTRHVPHDSPGDRLWRAVRQRHYPDWPDDSPLYGRQLRASHRHAERRGRMTVIATIAVRMGSSRLPGKAMREIAGKPLLGHLLDRVAFARRLDGVVVATSRRAENDVIAEYCRARGIACFRGDEDDVLGRILGALTAQDATIGLEVFGDGPLIDPAIVDRFVDLFVQSGGQLDFVGNDLTTTWPPGMEVEVFSVDALADAARRCGDPAIREHGTLFMRQNPGLYRLRNIEAPSEFRRPEIELEVDTAEDLAVMEAVLRHFSHRPDVGLSELIGFMDAHPDIAARNREVPRRWKEFRSGP